MLAHIAASCNHHLHQGKYYWLHTATAVRISWKIRLWIKLKHWADELGQFTEVLKDFFNWSWIEKNVKAGCKTVWGDILFAGLIWSPVFSLQIFIETIGCYGSGICLINWLWYSAIQWILSSSLLRLINLCLFSRADTPCRCYFGHHVHFED